MRAPSLLSLLLAIGCGGRATSIADDGSGSSSSSSGTSAGGDSAGSMSAAGNASGGSSAGGVSAGASGSGPCGVRCSSPFLDIQLAVMSSAGIGEVSGVQATLLGPVTVQLNCGGFAGTTRCFPTEGGPEGIYLLEANAPGFQTAVVSVTIIFTPAEGCGCASASANPSGVTLYPMRL